MYIVKSTVTIGLAKRVRSIIISKGIRHIMCVSGEKRWGAGGRLQGEEGPIKKVFSHPTSMTSHTDCKQFTAWGHLVYK
jgi:hypothetical protein